jgi:hypothetical protein
VYTKYYIILLIGIFLSLGLGILIGVTLENKDIIENQQILITRQIESEFSALRKETDMLRTNLEDIAKEKEQADSLCDYLFSKLTENRLKEVKISMISINASDAYYDLKQFLQLAGASIESSIIIEPELYTRQLDVTAVSDAGNEEMKEPEKFYNIVAEELIFSVIEGCATPLVNRIKELHFISISNDLEDYSDVIILFGNGREKGLQLYGNQYFDIELIQAAKNLGLPIIAVEPVSVSRSAIPEYKKMGISTVENIDTIRGKLALISILEADRNEFEAGNISNDTTS